MCPFCNKTENGRQKILEHVKITHPDFYVLFRLKKSPVLPEKCAACGWHFTSPADLQAHNSDECKKCIALKRAFIIALDPELCGPKSPSITSTGRDSYELKSFFLIFLIPICASRF